MEIKWTTIAEEYPPLGEDVWFCCRIDDAFTRVDKGRYKGNKTFGDALVMEAADDWSPCSHWMQLPPTPDLMTTAKQNGDDKLSVDLVDTWIAGETEYPGDMTIAAAMNAYILEFTMRRHYGAKSKASRELDNADRLICELRKYFNL